MISITISSEVPVSVPFAAGMNAQKALEESYPSIQFGVNYYGSLGYMVVMLNGIYDAPASGFYWQFSVNGVLSPTGIDGTILNDGDSISFDNIQYSPTNHANTLLEVKHQHAAKLASS